MVIAWHLLDPPCTERAFAAALPLAGLPAWRIYLGLPLTGARAPEGGMTELVRLGYQDAVRNLQVPIPRQAAAEYPRAYAALREQLGLKDGPVALVGGSAGSAAAQLVLADRAGPPVSAAVLISSIHTLRATVDALGRRYGISYPWDRETLAMAAQLDFVARADQIARMHAALPGSDLVTVEGMEHALADPPGVEPAPQLPRATRVDELAVAWLHEHLR